MNETRPKHRQADGAAGIALPADNPAAPATGHSMIADLVADLTAAKGNDARRPIRKALKQACAERSEELADHLEHEDCFTRWEVVNLLGELRDPRAAERVVQFALAENEVHARWRSFWAVTRFDRATVMPLLIAALRARKEPESWRAALVLSMLGYREAVPALIEGLDTDDSWIQWEALSALKSLRSPDAVDAILPFMKSGRLRSLRQEATLALGAIGGTVARAELERALRDTDPEIRWRASSGLARIGDARSIPALRNQLRTETHDATVRQLGTDLSRVEAKHDAT
jgi:HEAT repeat protein